MLPGFENDDMGLDRAEVLLLGWIGSAVTSCRRSQRVRQTKQGGSEGARINMARASKDA